MPLSTLKLTAMTPVILGAMLFLYWFGLFWDLRIDWATNEQYRFGWCVPWVVLLLLTEGWKTRPAPEAVSSPHRRGLQTAMMGMILLQIPLRFLGEANAEWRLLFWAREIQCVLLTLGFLVLAGGWKWARAFAFPILFTATAVPWPREFEGNLIQSLTRLSAAGTVEGLFWIGIPAAVHGNTIEVSTGLVGLTTACSGIRSLQVSLMLVLLGGEIWQLTPFRRFAVLILAPVMALTANTLRMIVLTWIEARQGRMSFEQWHGPAGWIEMGLCLLILLPLVRALRPRESVSATPVYPAILSPLFFTTTLALAAGLVWILAEAGTLFWFQSHASQQADAISWKITLPPLQDPDFVDWKQTEIPEESRALLRTNEGVALNWTDSEAQGWHLTYLHWPAGRSSAASAAAHHPDICLPAVGYRLLQEERPLSLTVQNLPLRFHHYLFEGHQLPVHVFYLQMESDLSASGDFTQTDRTALGRIRAALAGRRSEGQAVLQVILTGVSNEDQGTSALQRTLEKLITRERPHD